MRLLLSLLFKVVVARLNGPSNKSAIEMSAAQQTGSAKRSEDILWNCEVVQMGEIRNANTLASWQNGDSATSERKVSRCLGTPHPDYGYGNVNVYECNGLDNQIWALCSDGTVRNLVSKWCLTREPHGPQTGPYVLPGLNVVTSGCTVPTPSPAQLWLQADQSNYRDYLTGLRQTRFRLKNPSNQHECLGTPYGIAYDNGVHDQRLYSAPTSDVISSSLGGFPGTRCSGGDTETLWYFNNRGEIVGSGRLVNQATGKCFREGSERTSLWPLHMNVHEMDCKDDKRQHWTLYESGELMNANGDNWCFGHPDFCRGGRHCLAAGADLGADTVANAYGCRPYADIRWEAIDPVVGTFLIRNKESQQCLSISEGKLQMSSCIDAPDHRFRWETAGWESPVGEWVQRHCHYNGPAPRSFTSSTTSTRGVTDTTTVTVGVEIEKGVIFSGAKVSSSVSHAIARTWTQTSLESETVTFPCANFADGTPIVAFNCMYQWRQTVVWPRVDTIEWNPLVVWCTNSYEPPKCPLFEKCANPECSECESVLEV